MTDYQAYLESYIRVKNKRELLRREGDYIYTGGLGTTPLPTITGALVIAWEALTTMEANPCEKAAEWLLSPYTIQKYAGRAWLELPAEIQDKYPLKGGGHEDSVPHTRG